MRIPSEELSEAPSEIRHHGAPGAASLRGLFGPGRAMHMGRVPND